MFPSLSAHWQEGGRWLVAPVGASGRLWKPLPPSFEGLVPEGGVVPEVFVWPKTAKAPLVRGSFVGGCGRCVSQGGTRLGEQGVSEVRLPCKRRRPRWHGGCFGHGGQRTAEWDVSPTRSGREKVGVCSQSWRVWVLSVQAWGCGASGRRRHCRRGRASSGECNLLPRGPSCGGEGAVRPHWLWCKASRPFLGTRHAGPEGRSHGVVLVEVVLWLMRIVLALDSAEAVGATTCGDGRPALALRGGLRSSFGFVSTRVPLDASIRLRHWGAATGCVNQGSLDAELCQFVLRLEASATVVKGGNNYALVGRNAYALGKGP